MRAATMVALADAADARRAAANMRARWYAVLALLQILGYSAGLLGMWLGDANRLLRLPTLFLSLNLAALQAWGDALGGGYRIVWDRSDKEGC